MDLVGQCLFPVWTHQCHIVSNDLLIVNATIKSMINVSYNGSGGEWSHFPPSSAGCGFKDCNNIHGSGENHTFFLTVYCNEEPSCHNFINGNDGSLWKWQQQHKHGNVSLCSLIWCHVDDVGGDFLPTYCHDAGEHFLPWWWWGKTASLQSALSLPHKIDVGQMLQKQSASADNLWLTSWLGKTMSFKRRCFLTIWISLLDKQCSQVMFLEENISYWQFSAHCLTNS